VPHALSEKPGLALGAQAGEQRLREVATAAGFGRFRRVAQTPFNLVYEARPSGPWGVRVDRHQGLTAHAQRQGRSTRDFAVDGRRRPGETAIRTALPAVC
jgi:hypothetical protein